MKRTSSLGVSVALLSLTLLLMVVVVVAAINVNARSIPVDEDRPCPATVQFRQCVKLCSKGVAVDLKCITNCRKKFVLDRYKLRGTLSESDLDMLDDGADLSEFMSEDDLFMHELPTEESLDEETLSESQNGGFDSSQLWDRYKTALFYFLKRQGAAPGTDGFLGLQMVSEPLEATWYDSPYDLSVFANKMSEWGDEYIPSASRRFTDQYERFLDNIHVDLNSGVPPAVANDKKRIENEMHNLLSTLDDKRFQCITMWERFKSMFKNYSDFEKRNCLDVTNLEFSLTRLRGEFEEIKTRVAGPHRDVMDAVANFAFDTTQHAWEEWNSLNSFLAEARAGRATGMSLEFNSRTTVKETRTWTKKKKSGFIFKKKKTTTKEEVRFRNEHFNMRIEAAGFKGIRITPAGQWYSPNVVSKYKNSSTWTNKSLKFFGQTGSMSLMPRTIYVLYKPRIVLQVSKEDGMYFMEHKTSSFSFGPFASGKTSQMTVQKKSEDDYEVKFDTNVDAPYIVAIDYHIL